jgi:hypothetical protein
MSIKNKSQLHFFLQFYCTDAILDNVTSSEEIGLPALCSPLFVLLLLNAATQFFMVKQEGH